MAYNSSDYGEIFCQAVTNIVNNAVSNLQFDISKECTIIKINDKAHGKYLVSDGSMSFEAISIGDIYYEIGDQVIVSIPKGDYNQQINIVNKVFNEWSSPIGFVRPLDTVMKCTDNISINASSGALAANGQVQSINLLHLTEQKFFGFQKIGISADFKSLINNLNIIKGSYGLNFTLVNANRDVQLFSFTSEEMLGNPYEFSTFFTQEYAFDIPENFDQIVEIIVDFFQNQNFYDGNDNKIVPIENINNLFVQNLALYFGYGTSKELDEIVTITSNNLTYTSSSDTRDIDLTWFHKINDNLMEEITSSKIQSGDYDIKWYQYSPGCDESLTDDYGGKNWQLLNIEQPDPAPENYPFKLTVDMRGSRTNERIKAIALIKTRPLANDETYIVWEQYKSNELVFENISNETSGGEAAQEVSKKELSLLFRDNSLGNYYIYDQNGDLIDRNEGSIKERVLEIVYSGLSINEDNPVNITDIVWTLPQKAFSMLSWEEDQWNGQELKTTFKYNIGNYLNQNFIDNTIKCSIYIDGQLCTTLTETLMFGKKGTSGTSTTFLLEMLDGKNVLTNEKDETLRVQAILISNTGKRIYLSDGEKEKITWSLINPHSNITLTNTDDKGIISLSYSGDIPNNNYTILSAEYNYDGAKLVAYLPIPIATSDYDRILGATQIIYNHQGIPKYNNGMYEIYKNGSAIIENVEWKLTQDKTNPNPVSLKSISSGKGLSATPLYSKRVERISDEDVVCQDTIQDKVCVYCKVNDNIIWSQPILIMQSPYDFAMLNSWDGSLTLDENSGTILSTMLGAGRKDNNGKFSGVLIGDIQGGTELEETETMTGVYGFQNGVMTYGLRENGTAFFGAYNKGRIEIDGKSGVIRSPSENGMTIDLDDGSITAKNFNLTAGNDTNGKISITNNFFEISKGTDKISFSTGNDGLNISAKNFNLSAGDDTNGKINITNNSFEIGKGVDKISFSTDNNAKLNISASQFNLVAGTWGSGRIEINSNGDNGYYFAAGVDNYSGKGAFGNDKEKYITIGPDNFEIKTPNFWIDTDGNVQIKGNITATSLSLNSTLLVGDEPSDKTQKGFKVTSDGTMSASGATIYGIIYATGGEIGGCKIEKNTLTIASANIANLSVDKLTAGTNINKLTFTDIHAEGGTIGGWTLNKTSLKSGTEGSTGFIGLWTSYPTDANYRLRIGSKFSVKSDGQLSCSSGNIGGWDINSSSISRIYTGYSSSKTIKLDGSGVYVHNGGISSSVAHSVSWETLVIAANRVSAGGSGDTTIKADGKTLTFTDGILTKVE